MLYLVTWWLSGNQSIKCPSFHKKIHSTQDVDNPDSYLSCSCVYAFWLHAWQKSLFAMRLSICSRRNRFISLNSSARLMLNEISARAWVCYIRSLSFDVVVVVASLPRLFLIYCLESFSLDNKPKQLQTVKPAETIEHNNRLEKEQNWLI